VVGPTGQQGRTLTFSLGKKVPSLGTAREGGKSESGRGLTLEIKKHSQSAEVSFCRNGEARMEDRNVLRAACFPGCFVRRENKTRSRSRHKLGGNAPEVRTGIRTGEKGREEPLPKRPNDLQKKASALLKHDFRFPRSVAPTQKKGRNENRSLRYPVGRCASVQIN